MEVIQAKSAGFCFGVARAVKMARELAEADPRPRMLGSVIHNRHVTAALAEGGMDCTLDFSLDPALTDELLVFRFGQDQEIYDISHES